MNVATETKASLSLLNVYEISKILTSSVDLQAQLRAVLNLLASYMEMRRGIVAITGGDGEMRVVAAAGLSANAVNDGAADLPKAIAERIMAGQAPFVTENVEEDPLLRITYEFRTCLKTKPFPLSLFPSGPLASPSAVSPSPGSGGRRRRSGSARTSAF